MAAVQSIAAPRAAAVPAPCAARRAQAASAASVAGPSASAMPFAFGPTFRRQAGRSLRSAAPRVGSTTMAALAGEVQSPVNDLSMCETKSSLLRALAGLDRGFAAGDAEVALVEETASGLEGRQGPMDELELMDAVAGRWRLVYSSGFTSGSLGGSRPGPPSIATPVLLGQVFQWVRPSEGRLDNIVTLRGPTVPLVGITPEVTVILGHEMETLPPRSIRITSDSASVEMDGPLPSIGLPKLPEQINELRELRSAEFENTYVDGEIRISRGDKGELRVYTRA